MGRILGIDMGQKRVGLAVTDPLRIIATGLATVPVSEIFSFLSGYTEKEKVDLFVVGLPSRMNNKPSDSVKYVEPFVRKLTKAFPEIPVKQFDERFTTKMAKQAMVEGGAGKEKRRDKAMADKISAVILLQSFLYQEEKREQ